MQTILYLSLFLMTTGATRNMNICILYSSQGVFASYGATVPISATAWLQAIAQRGGIAQTGVIPSLFYGECASDPAQTATATLALMTSTPNGGCDVVIAPETYLAGITASLTSAYGNIPTIATQAATSDVFLNADGSRKWSNLVGPMVPGRNYWNSLLNIAHLKGATTSAVIWYNEPPANDVCSTVGTASNTARIHLVANKMVTPNATDPSQELEQLTEAMVEIARLAPDVLIVCSTPTPATCALLLRVISSFASYSPMVLGMFECANYGAALPEDVRLAAQWIISPRQWDDRLQGQEYTDDNRLRNYANLFPLDVSSGTPSSKQFQLMLQDRMPANAELSSLVADQLAGLYMIEYAVQLANSTQRGDLQRGLNSVTMESFAGLIVIDSLGQNNLRQIPLVQMDSEGAAQVVYPLESGTMDLVIPMPTWTERVYTPPGWSSDTSTLVVLWVAIGALPLALIIAISLVAYRKNSTIRKSSWKFSLMTVGGYCILMWAPLSWTADMTTCSGIHIVLLTLGVSGFYMPLLSKTMRIVLIFSRQRLEVLRLSDSVVFLLMMLVLVLPVVLLDTLLLSIDPLKLQLYQPDLLRPSLNYHDCTVGSFGTVMLALNLGWFALTLLVGVVTSIMATTLKQEVYSDSRAISFSIYNFSVLSILTGVLTFAFRNSHPTTVFLMRSLCIQIAATVSLALLFVPRLRQLYCGVSMEASKSRFVAPYKGTSPTFVGDGEPKRHSGSEGSGHPTQQSGTAPGDSNTALRTIVVTSPQSPRPSTAIPLPGTQQRLQLPVATVAWSSRPV